MNINKNARIEITSKLTDEAMMEIQTLMRYQYRAGYEYAQFRQSQCERLGIPDKPADDVLAVVVRETKVEEFRAMIRGQ